MKEKIYINSVGLKEHVFQDGGTILKVSIAKAEINTLAAQLAANADGDWVNLVITRKKKPVMSKRDPSKIAFTHSLEVDTWKPNQQPAPKVDNDPWA